MFANSSWAGRRLQISPISFANLQRKVSLWQGWNRIVTITHVPVGPGAAIKDSRWRVVQHSLEIILRKIPPELW